ncbi:hypothetical protein HNQ07_001322 [Deinococcus metalli]|uniref:Glycosyl hydrolase family 98 putative carbohydrate-binding module domain-containing protein n=1 Tax=Deinococcus metalli TaxID=1141878 RepID=A0A7W8KCU9_9DEIO|nr:NPCBM/NEW2 domain-containing protein [Deinococcus metalli]MBB5375865.1 hypothetical protein [Deinococcus metalli]GHF36451.1 hypothetical protein GCM10017781_11380 [Deinococcus metalli]
MTHSSPARFRTASLLLIPLALAACSQAPSAPKASAANGGKTALADGVGAPWVAKDNGQNGKLGALALSSGDNQLSNVGWASATSGWGPVELNTSSGESNGGDGRTITLNGATYSTGLGVHSNSTVTYSLGGQCSTFASDIGVDDEVGSIGSVVFQVWADGVKIYDSGTMTGSSATKSVNVGIAGKSELKLVVTDAGDGNAYDHADWANARVLSCSSSSSTTKIADEYGNFTVSGTQTVRYGADTRWLTKTVTNSGSCTNAFFGGDPAPGVTKACYVVATSASKLADEYGNFTVSGTQTVRYGADTRWLTKTVTNSGSCTNAFFGGDPAPGVTKACYIDSTAPAPAPSPAPSTTITYGAPLVITKGGTYTGNYQSTDPNVPAITVRTSEPVVIDGANLKGPGHLIQGFSMDLTVRNTKGYGVNPNVNGRNVGRFISSESTINLNVTNNYFEGTGGIYVRSFVGNTGAGQTIKILRNSAKNIDGRFSNGAGGYQNDFYRVQFVQFNSVRNVANAEIAWNQVINEPYKSALEENINMYETTGTPSSRIKIHDNLIWGAYAPDPANTSGYAGGGILLGDGSSTLSLTGGWVDVYNNTIISTTNEGTGIAGGHDHNVYNNRYVSSGLLPDGRKIAAQNVGLYVWDQQGSISGGVWANNTVHDNQVTWMRYNSDGTTFLNNTWFANCTAALCYNNTPLYSTATLSTETTEFNLWKSRASAAGQTIGTN